MSLAGSRPLARGLGGWAVDEALAVGFDVVVDGDLVVSPSVAQAARLTASAPVRQAATAERQGSGGFDNARFSQRGRAVRDGRKRSLTCHEGTADGRPRQAVASACALIRSRRRRDYAIEGPDGLKIGDEAMLNGFRAVALAIVTVALCAGCQTPAGAGSAPPPRPPHGAEGGLCGGIAGFQCQAGLYCQFKPGECRTVADAGGTCRKAPQICNMIYAPVCGCDGKTYSNACVAASKGASVASQGACKG